MSVEILHTWKETTLSSLSAVISVGDIVKDTVLIAVIVKSGAAATTAQPAGWIQVYSEAFSTYRFEVWKKQATSTEPASYAWSGDSQDYIISIHELHRANFNSVAITSSSAGNSINPLSPEIVNATVESMSLMLSGCVIGAGAGSLTLNADHTETVNEIQANISMLAGHRNFHKIYFTEDSSSAIDTSPYPVRGIGLSEDGLDLVIGIPEGGDGETYKYGMIKSYHRSSLTANWSKSSNDIENAPEGVDGVGLGTDISLSADGLTFSTGTEQGKMFYWNRSTVTQNWSYVDHLTLFGRDINYGYPLTTNDPDGSFSYNMAMSSDGLHLSGGLFADHTVVPSYIWGDVYDFTGTMASFSRVDINSQFVIDDNELFYWDAKVSYEYAASTVFYFADKSIGMSEDKFTAITCSADFGRVTGMSSSGVQTLFRAKVEEKWLPIHHQQFSLVNNTNSGQCIGLNSTGLSFSYNERFQHYTDHWNYSSTLKFYSRENNIAKWEKISTYSVKYILDSPIEALAYRLEISDSGNALMVSNLDYLTRSLINCIPEIGHTIDTSADWLSFFLSIEEDVSYTRIESNIPAGEIFINGSTVGGNPIANYDEYEVDHDKILTVPISGVLANDEYIP